MNKALQAIYRADIKDRNQTTKKWVDQKIINEIEEKDRKRKTIVEKLIKKGLLKDASDFHHAALIFQHGENPEDYKKANEFAAKAIKMGDNSAKWLYAATLDRWLLSTGKPQKFGTQFIKNNKGKWQIAKPIDKNTTDEERKAYFVPPLKDALNTYKQKYGFK